MCEISEGRNIAFIGDSLQHEMYVSFLSMSLGYVVSSISENTSIVEHRRKKASTLCDTFCRSGMICDKPINIDCGPILAPFTITFIRDDFLSDAKTWINRIRLYNITFVLLNTGAHHVEYNTILVNVNSTITMLFDLFPQVVILYRNTPSGHSNCRLHHTSAPTSKWHLNASEYHWSEFQNQNKMIQNFISEYFPSVLYIDVAHSTQFRPDSHVSDTDCLHYCLPGPISEWVIFHYNALIMLSKLKDGEINVVADLQEVSTASAALPDGAIFSYDSSFFLIGNGTRHFMKNISSANSAVAKDIWNILELPIGRPLNMEYP